MKRSVFLFAVAILGLFVIGQSRAQSTYEPYTFITLAGSAGDPGSADGAGSAARFERPTGVAVDNAGNVYVADGGNNTIRKVTPTGAVTTLAGLAGSSGSADGTGSAARFNFSDRFGGGTGGGVAVDGAGNVYVAEFGNATIRKVTPAGMVTTLAGLAGNLGSADGTGSGALFGSFRPSVAGPLFHVGPTGVAVDRAGNVYVADSGNNTIRKGFPALIILTSGAGFGFNGGHFGFNVTGPAGQSVLIEASPDLANWFPIWTNTLTGTLNFTDPQSATSSSNRFYRAHNQ